MENKTDRIFSFALLRTFITTLALLIATISLTACVGANEAFKDSEGKVKVTATIGMITDVVKQVGGEHVAVIGLMKSGTDPHLYKASQGDISKLEQADIVLYNGLHLEGKLVEIFERMGKKKPVFAVSDRIERTGLRSGEQMETEYDPHIWFDVSHWMIVTETIRDTLIEFDSANAEHYRANAETYLKQLEQLHHEVAEKIATIPEERRVLVTAHDAFGYFGDAYGITVMGLQGISTASEAGTKDVIDLRNYLVDHQVKAVFIESSVPRRAIDAVIKGANEKGHHVEIGGELFSDALGKEGTPEGTYVGMVRHNVDTIVRALK